MFYVILILMKFNFNSHMWVVATIQDKAILQQRNQTSLQWKCTTSIYILAFCRPRSIMAFYRADTAMCAERTTRRKG